jgi:hypothetical protein
MHWMTKDVGSDSGQGQEMLSSLQCPDHNVKLNTHIHLVPRLKTHGAVPPLLHISWYGALLSTGITFFFSYEAEAGL